MVHRISQTMIKITLERAVGWIDVLDLRVWILGRYTSLFGFYQQKQFLDTLT